MLCFTWEVFFSGVNSSYTYRESFLIKLRNVLWNFLDSEFTSYIPVSLFGFMGTLSGEEEQILKPDRLVVKFHGYVNNCCKLVKP